MAESLPRKESELIQFAKNFMQTIIADFAGYELEEADADELEEAFVEALTAFEGNKAKQHAARAAKALKDTKIKRLTAVIRQKARRIRASGNTPNSKIARLGLRVRDEILTRVGVPETAPVFEILLRRTRHIIRFWEEGSKRRRRKPKGVIGAEIYQKIGEDGEFKVLTFAANTPHTIDYDMPDVGKQAYYYLRWVTRRNERSEMSLIHSATITG